MQLRASVLAAAREPKILAETEQGILLGEPVSEVLPAGELLEVHRRGGAEQAGGMPVRILVLRGLRFGESHTFELSGREGLAGRVPRVEELPEEPAAGETVPKVSNDDREE